MEIQANLTLNNATNSGADGDGVNAGAVVQSKLDARTLTRL